MTIKRGGVYRHYKGGLYYVLGVGKHTETGEELVVYRGVNGGSPFWCRPLSKFIEKLDDGRPRFTEEG